MSNTEQKVVAIQVAPFKVVTNSRDKQDIEIQTTGADANTTGYGVYLRLENGEAKHVFDRQYEAAAVSIAKMLCEEHQVSIELFGWQIPHVKPTGHDGLSTDLNSGAECINKYGFRSFGKTGFISYKEACDKQMYYGFVLRHLVASAIEDGVSLSITNTPTVIEAPDSWGRRTSFFAVEQTTNTQHMESPESVSAEIIMKRRMPEGCTAHDKFDYIQDGQYVPELIGNENNLAGETAVGLSAAQVDLMLGKNREIADSGQIDNAMILVTTGDAALNVVAVLVDNPAVTEDGTHIKDGTDSKLEYKTFEVGGVTNTNEGGVRIFETRGDHSPSKE